MSTVIEPIDAGKALAASQYTTIATIPSDALSATVNIRFVARDLTQNVATRLAICPIAFVDGVTPPSDDDWIQPVDLVLGPNGITVGIIEDSGVVIKPGRKIVAFANKVGVTAHVHGFLKKVGA